MFMQFEIRKFPFNGYLVEMETFSFEGHMIVYAPDGRVHGFFNGIHRVDLAERFHDPHKAMRAFIQSVG